MARLLASTDLSTAKMPRPVGWTDPFYVSRAFRARYGISSTEYCHRQTQATLDY